MIIGLLPTPPSPGEDWATAMRNCQCAYRHWRTAELMKGRSHLNYWESFDRHYREVTVPPIVALYEETTGEVFDVPEAEPQRLAA